MNILLITPEHGDKYWFWNQTSWVQIQEPNHNDFGQISLIILLLSHLQNGGNKKNYSYRYLVVKRIYKFIPLKECQSPSKLSIYVSYCFVNFLKIKLLKRIPSPHQSDLRSFKKYLNKREQLKNCHKNEWTSKSLW